MWAGRLRQRLAEPRDAAGLVAFRVALGVLVAVSALRFLVYGWVDRLLVAPGFHFKYWGLEWVPALGAPWMHLVFAALVVLGVAIAAGVRQRAAAAVACLLFTWVQLIDVSTYLNHYYLVS